MEPKKYFLRKIPLAQIRKRVQAQWHEDGARDITSEACLAKGKTRAAGGKRLAVAVIEAQCGGVVCGLLEAAAVFAPLKTRPLVKEGNAVRKGTALMEIEGDAAEILRRERVALNYLQVFSGIATETRKWTKKYPGKIASLRKVHPGLALSEKRAVQVAGGMAHRISLADGYLVKGNHLRAIMREKKAGREKAAAIAAERCLRHKRKHGLPYLVEIEVESLGGAQAAVKAGAEAILVDNQTPAALKKIAQEVRKINKRILIEASGGIREKNAGEYLAAGADFVSTSALTFGSRPLKMHLVLKS